jgi:Rha family phage regulatory protein
MIATLPTKADLQKGSLVDFTGRHKSESSNSLKIANALNVKHSNVTRVIRKLTVNEKISRLNCEPSEYLNERGKSYRYYILDETASLQVVMGLSGAKAEQLHKEIAQAFVSMKKENAEWRTQALLTTDTTKQANDHIHWLQKELTKVIPTSMRCTLLFVHIQGAITKAATGSAKTKRDMMTACQLFQIGKIEQQVRKNIERLRREGIAAEQIREAVMGLIKAQSKSDETEAIGLQISRVADAARLNQSLATGLNNGV